MRWADALSIAVLGVEVDADPAARQAPQPPWPQLSSTLDTEQNQSFNVKHMRESDSFSPVPRLQSVQWSYVG